MINFVQKITLMLCAGAFLSIASAQPVKWVDNVSLAVNATRIPISDLNLIDVENIPVFVNYSGQVRNLDSQASYELELGVRNASQRLLWRTTKAISGSNLINDAQIQFSNEIFNTGKIYPNQVVPFDWNPGEENLPSAFEEEVLNKGALPSGEYYFYADIRLYGESYSVAKIDAETSITIEDEPTFLDLIYPGFHYSDEDIPMISQENPVFQWRAQQGIAGESPFSGFRVKFYEKLPVHQSLEDVLNSIPVFEKIIQDGTITQLEYPLLEAEPLQPGHTYVWLVEGLVSSLTAADQVGLMSDIFAFKLRNPDDNSFSAFGEVEVALREIFGGDVPEEVVEKLRGYTYQSGEIYINDKKVTLAELLDIIRAMRSQNQDGVLYNNFRVVE
jgi:hypothetical protein